MVQDLQQDVVKPSSHPPKATSSPPTPSSSCWQLVEQEEGQGAIFGAELGVFPSVLAVSDLPLGGNLALLQPRAWLLCLQRQKGAQRAWERRARCPSLPLRYQTTFGSRCSYLLKGFKEGRQGWAVRCFPEMSRLAPEGPFPALEPLEILPAPLWQERDGSSAALG